MQAGLRQGEVDVGEGAHALIEERGGIDKLGLGGVDEQHPFGGMERDGPRGEGGSPHQLVMTPTPCPPWKRSACAAWPCPR